MGISASRAKLSLVACACLSLAACGGDDESSTTANDTGGAPVSENEPPTSPPAGGGATTGTPGDTGADESSGETPSDTSEGTSNDSGSTPGDATDGTDAGAPTGGTAVPPTGSTDVPSPDSTDEPSSGSSNDTTDTDDGSSTPTDDPLSDSTDDSPPDPTDEPPPDPTDEAPADADASPDEPPVVENSPPTIGGTPPPMVLEEMPYLFVPISNDADGDLLHFSIVNLPGWAAFEPTTGRLEGTPSSADVGTYDDVRISVTDGADDAHLQAFSITVTPVANGAVELSWLAPSENIDGSPLTDLAGYKIYWGTEPGEYPNSVTIDNPGIVTYVLEGLVPDTYYFVATAFNAEGTESDPSDVTTATIS